MIGMASTTNLDYVRQLGADEVIDYNTQKFEELLHDIDVVLEASPVRDNGARIRALSVLREGGGFVSVNTDFKFNSEMIAAINNKKVKAELAPNQARQEWLTEIAALIDEGKVQVFIDKVFPFEQAAEAHRESETWHVRGKLVLEIRT